MKKNRFSIAIDSNDRKSLWDDERTEEEPLICLDRFGEISGIDDCCNLLNELYDEREQLTHDASVLIQVNKDYRKEIEDLKKSDSLVDLQDENKELKEQLKQCKNLINDIRMGRIHDENKKEYFRLNGWKNE